ncbi:MAG: HAD-IIIA family hydrolase [Steroidobacteraceae bacterium]
MIQAVVLAGGKGTRLKSITGDTPKPLARANGRELLDMQFSSFAATGIRDVLVLTGFGGDFIEAFSRDSDRWGLRITCNRETTARGTFGALVDAAHLLEDQFLLTYGDTVFDIDLARLVANHRNSGAVATLLLHPNDHPHDSDLVEVDDQDRIVAFHPHPHPMDASFPNLVNAAMYVMERRLLDIAEAKEERPDFGKHIFPRLLRRGIPLQGYRSPEYIKDAGTPERLTIVSRDLASGRVRAMTLRNPAPAIFLDRDGTVNVERSHISRPDDLSLIPGAGEAIAKLNASFYRTVIVTNQAGIAKGKFTEVELQLIHNRLESLLGEHKAFVDRIYYCPHIPDRGFPGERVDLKIECNCRKPRPGMLIQAATDMNIDFTRSWMIGDSSSDIEAARRVGVSTVLLASGHAGRDGKFPVLPDVECFDLADAVSFLLERLPALVARLSPLVTQIRRDDVVLIGGQARSGKTQAAAGLRQAVTAAGLPSVVIPLDCWLRSAEDRHGSSVLDRYDLATASNFLSSLNGTGGSFMLPRYDRKTRRSIPDGVRLDIPAGAVLIVEGVPALSAPLFDNSVRHRVAIFRDETRRRASLTKDYASRGFAAEEIIDLIAARGAEEVPLVNRDLVSATFRIELDTPR